MFAAPARDDDDNDNGGQGAPSGKLSFGLNTVRSHQLARRATVPLQSVAA